MSSLTDSSWIEAELSCTHFSEKRLKSRFKFIAKELAERPNYPINQASTNWAASKAAYRFFENPKVSYSQILKPHIENTVDRLSKRDRVVIVQDTTFFDYSKHKKTSGLGKLNSANGFKVKGLLMHTTLALSDNGLPLGIIDQHIWSRKEQKKSGHEHTKIPLHQKESFRWIKGLRKSAELCSEKTSIVTVCDREADIYEFFQEAIKLETDVVVRLQHNRVIDDEIGDDINLKDYLGTLKSRGKLQIEIPGSGSRKKRTANMKVFFKTIIVQGKPRGVSTKRVSKRSDIELNIVELREVNPAEGTKKLHWILLTTLAVNSFSQAKEVMNYYKKRWKIELFFKTLKSGCAVKDCRLESADKLMKYITLKSVIAWRLFWMSLINRISPNVCCEVVLTPSEWKTLWLKRNRQKIKSKKIKPSPPEKPPTLYEAIRWIAMEGGFLGRKGDGEPGIQSIWRGWQELEAGVEVWDLIHG